jgi:hypothetical protein
MENAQGLIVVVVVIQLALFIFVCWVIYMFYARLRDIGDELRKLRIDYEFAQERRSTERDE